MDFDDDDYAKTAESGFRSRVTLLLDADKGRDPDTLPNGLPTGLTYAVKLLEAGAEGLLTRFCAITNLTDRGDAFSEAEMLIEGSLLIALYSAESVDTAANNFGRLRERQQHIKALEKLYSNDPVKKGEISRKHLREVVANALGVRVEKIDPKTLDRARKLAWSKRLSKK